jgi:DNA-binding GntR family transcriptional regulator
MIQVQALSTVEAVAAELRRGIFVGDLASDAHVTEAEVAANYGVARPTAKAAIEKLVSERLLRRGLHKTARVPVIGPDDIRDLCQTRSLIETKVVARLAEQRKIPVATAQSHATLREILPTADITIIEPIINFHVTMVNAFGSQRTSRLYETLMGEMRLAMAQMHNRRTLSGKTIAQEHEKIMKCIAAGDSEGAVRELERHLQNATARLRPDDAAVWEIALRS